MSPYRARKSKCICTLWNKLLFSYRSQFLRTWIKWSNNYKIAVKQRKPTCSWRGTLRWALPLPKLPSSVKNTLCYQLSRGERGIPDWFWGDCPQAQRVVAEKKIKGEFAQLHQFLREEEEARLTAIRKEAERAWIITERELKIIRGQMHVLTESISRLEKDMKKDDYAFFKVQNSV